VLRSWPTALAMLRALRRFCATEVSLDDEASESACDADMVDEV
jgi:hypothetical protein